MLTDKEWNNLLRAIKEKRCTPFLGAGACYGVLPLGGDIARQWTKDYQYPLEDSYDLIKVSQFLAVDNYPMFPKDLIAEMFEKLDKRPDFNSTSEPHRVLAELPIKVYLTTNYDSFMAEALKKMYRDPKQEICRWNTLTKNIPSSLGDKFEPTVANPVVFHLHGELGIRESLVLTEDDYFDFLVNISRDSSIIPSYIESALTSTSLLFIGYRLADWNFRVLLQGLSRFVEKGLGRDHIAVMPPPAGADTQSNKIQEYLSNYYKEINVKVYWGTAQEFMKTLREKWKALDD
jgi:hypothetical protein